MSQAAQGTPRSSLDAIVDRILASYRELGGINHIEGPNLPSRQSVERIVEVQLSPSEREAFQKSIDAVKKLVETMTRLIAKV